jgi:CBS domain-containing protein
MRVEDIMSTEVTVARPDMSLKEAARLLVEHGVSGLPVVSDAGEVVGVISETDLLPHSADPPRRRRALARLLERDGRAALDSPARVVADAMSAPAITVEAFWTIPGAAHVIRERGIKRLPVVRAGRLVGILSRADIVRAFARSDDDIEREVRELVDFQRALWSDGLSVDVAVHRGEVTLSGGVERRSLAATLPALAERVPGVVAVASQLSWEDDDREPSRAAR